MKLADWRQIRGITQADLAAQLGVDKSAVMRWEAGDRDPGRAIKQRLFVLSGGAVEPNDFYDLPLWRRLVDAAMAAIRSEAA